MSKKSCINISRVFTLMAGFRYGLHAMSMIRDRLLPDFLQTYEEMPLFTRSMA